MVQAERRVGRYDLLEVIGRGGAAVVYLAYQRDLDRRVALKELLAQHLADPNFAERFVEESRLAGAMSHSSIVTVHEFFEHDGVPYIAMEYLPRGSLRPYVGRLSIAQIAGMLESVLAGLSHGESQGIVHRDLKPENLLIAADGRVKIADFGVARAYNAAATRAVVTATGTTIGTPAYMAPEQALGETLTPATDLYSLGIVAWEMLTGTVPFESTDTPVSMLYRHVHEPVPHVSEVDPEVDERLAGWLDRLLAKRPADRFQSAEGAWEELEDVVIDLLGPRWRRDARLGTDPAEPDRRPLTPAQFETHRGENADAAATEVPAEAAASEVPAQAAASEVPAQAAASEVPPQAAASEVPAQAAATEVPAQAAATEEPREAAATEEPREADSPPPPVPASVGRTTILRPGRRHHPAEETAPTRDERPTRRRAVIAALVVATALAAGAGALVGALTSGGSSHRAGRTTTTRSTAALDRELAGVLQSLATARAGGLAQLHAAHTTSQLAAAATTIANAYQAAAGQIAALPGSPPSLQTTVADLAASYGALATAARAGNATGLRQASAQVASQEEQLRTHAGRL
jgi:tRNA A-37 threonylcarbamoyl transferase component Bud32